MLMRECYNVAGKMTSFLLECLHFPPLWLVSLARLTGAMALKGLMSFRADNRDKTRYDRGRRRCKITLFKGIVSLKVGNFPFLRVMVHVAHVQADYISL